jgi:hypothetical protein
MALNKQMEMFEDGGLKEEGGMVDEVSGNDVPAGSTREEVRDDIPAQLSEGEFVFPADVVRYLGLEKLMKLRQEAKQGLKQMEAMGQMGNSEEATMPDDLPFDETDLDVEDEEDVPFDETDLDTEDDLEYNIGGYVPQSYTPPVIQNIPQMNVPQFPMQPGVPPMPSIPQGTNQPKLAGFSQLMDGTSFNQSTQNLEKPVLPQAELVRYVNKTTKQVRMIPHLNNPDGSRGDTLYPIPEGFLPQKEDPKKKAQKTTKVPTAKVDKVDSEEGGDDGGKGPGVTAVDPAGDALSYQSIGKKDALDKNMAKVANMQLGLLGIGKGGITAGIIGKVGRGLLGKTDIEAINLGAVTAYYTQSKKELGVYGKNIANLDKTTRNALSKSIDRAFSSVVNLTTDSNGDQMGTQETIEAINALADIYGVEKINTNKRNYNLNVVIGKTIGEIDKQRDKVRDRMIRRGLMTPQQGFNPEEALGVEGLSTSQQKGIQDVLSGKTAPSLSPSVGTPTQPSGSLGSQNSIESNDSVSGDTPGASEGPTGGIGDYNIGGLAGKKKSKPKNMKRGGLASKK